MPIKSIPEEIREEYEKIMQRLKTDNPKWSGEKRAKVAWGIIKKRYYKNDKGKWVLKKGVKGSVVENFESWWSLHAAKEIALEEELMEMIDEKTGDIILQASCNLVELPQGFSIDTFKPTFEAAKIPMPPRKDSDILYIKQRLLHTEPFVNSNRFIFPVEDIVGAVNDGQFKPEAGSYVDINHDGIIYGWTLDAEIEDSVVEGKAVKGLNVYKIFLAYRYPTEAQAIKLAYKEGNLGASMACNPQTIECSVCNDNFDNLSSFLSHEHGNTGNLILHKPRFRASSIILKPFTPADKHTGAIQFEGASEEDKKAQKARASKYGIGIKKEGHVTKPSKYSNVSDSDFLDGTNYRYPIDEKHLMPALKYFNHDGQREAGGYTTEEWAKMGKKLAAKLGKGYSYKNGQVVKKEVKSLFKTADDQPVHYDDYKEEKEEQRQERFVWEVVDPLSETLQNILASDEENKFKLIQEAFSDAYSDFISLIESGNMSTASVQINYNELKKYREARNKVWDITSTLSAVLRNIIESELENKEDLYKQAFVDAFNDFITQTGIKESFQSREDNEMEKDEQIKALAKEIEDLKAKVKDYEEADRNKVLKEKEDTIQAQKEKIEQLEADVAEKDKTIGERDSTIEGLNAKTEELEKVKAKYDEMTIESKNKERKEKIESFKFEADKTAELISKYELKMEEDKVVGRTDEEFKFFVEAVELGSGRKPEETPSGKVKDSENLNIPPGGGDEKTSLDNKLKMLSTGKKLNKEA